MSMSDGNPTASQAASARQQTMRRALDYYCGHADPQLRRTPGQPDDNLLVGLARLVVDKGVSYLFGEDTPAQVGGPKPARRQDWLDECWRRNRRELTLQKYATNGAIAGHAFARLLDSKPFPRVVVLDPLIVDAQPAPDDIDEVWRFVITPPARIDEETGEETRTRTVIENAHAAAGYRLGAAADERWAIIDQRCIGGSWITQATAAWPYPFCPIIHNQNLPRANDFWGESDLPADVLHTLDGINGVTSRINKILRLHAHPKTWTRGMGKASIDFSIDSVISLPSETAELKTLEMQSDLASSLAFLEKLLNLLSMQVRIPLVALGQPDALGQLSGVALRIRYEPLLQKTRQKQLSYGLAYEEMCQRMLAMAALGDATDLTIQWPNLVPQDALEARQVAVLDDSLGIASRTTLAAQFNYDFAAEQKLITEEKTAAAKLAQQLSPDTAPGTQPADGEVPPPAALGAPLPDIAKTARSR